MVRYKSKDNKIIQIRKKIKEKNKKQKSSINKETKLKIAALIAAGTLSIAIPIVGELAENITLKQIKENASIDTAFRDFRNLNKKNMGTYLSAQIDALYEKYPDLNEMIFYGNEKTKTNEFINDIYMLYKAYMVDETDKEIENINDVKVVTVDRIVSSSDRVMNGKQKLKETHMEEYKSITDEYIKAKEETRNGAGLAKQMYELLASEIHLEKNAITSKQMAEEIEEKGFYYDEKNNKFYTKDGPATLIPDIEIEKTQEDEIEL